MASHRQEPPGIALITGAGSGLGRQLALDLGARGWKIAALDVQHVGLETLQDECTLNGYEIATASADVEDAAVLDFRVRQMERTLGPVDLLIASAGIARDTPAVGLDPAAVARLIGVNLIGVSNTIASVLPGMLARGRGHIVAISSLASAWGLPNQMGYCASKAGLNVLMQSLALDVRRHGILTTTICPAPIATPQAVGMYNADRLMPVALAAAHVLHAIDSQRQFYAFPKWVALQLRLLRWLPARLRERLLTWHANRSRPLPASRLNRATSPASRQSA